MENLKRLFCGLLLACAWTGCSETHEHGCGEGAALKHAGANYCVYEASIIEEGFSCPAHVPNEYDFDGFKACGVPAEPPDDLDERIFEVFRPDASASDAGGTCEYIGRTFSHRDEFCAEDGCNTCGCFDGGVICGGIRCIYPEASLEGGIDAGTTRCTPGEIIVREPPECEGRAQRCAVHTGNGCCGEMESPAECIDRTWTCPKGTLPNDTCVGFGPYCGDAGVLPNQDGGA